MSIDLAGIESIVDQLCESVRKTSGTDSSHHANMIDLPTRHKSEQILAIVRKIVFPGLFTDNQITEENIKYHLGMLLSELKELLVHQITLALAYQKGSGGATEEVQEDAKVKTNIFLGKINDIRSLLLLDVAASMRGDPAAKSHEEIVLCYPGIEAVFVHRVAHQLYRLGIPLLPRMMSEYAHQKTAIDIHPGAQIGTSFFIDHGTGVVIGETAVIGNNVKLFHGVTLGALSTKDGQALAGKKRHPTIEDDVTIYAGAVVLGGGTVVGRGATIGGSVFLTRSVPPGYVVTGVTPELHLRKRGTGSHDYDCFDPCI